MTTTPTGQTRDADGNLTGTVHLADGTTETVDGLNAWADAFEDNDRPAPLTPARPGRPNLARTRGHSATGESPTATGESPRVTVRLPPDLLVQLDAAVTASASSRADLIRDALLAYLPQGSATTSL